MHPMLYQSILHEAKCTLLRARKRQRMVDEHREHHAQLMITSGFPESGGGRSSASKGAAAPLLTVTDGNLVKGEATASSSAAPAATDDDDGGDPDPEPERPGTGHLRIRRPKLSPPPSGGTLWKLPTVLQHFPVSRAGWYAGVKAGRYPQAIKLGPRSVAWRATDIHVLIESLMAAG